MAENIDVNVNVNATQAQRNLNNLNTQIKNTSDSFGKLRAALGSIAFGAIISNTLRFADGIQDVADSTGIATASILGFNAAVQQNGGDAEKANTAIQKLVQSIGEAAQGSAKTQEAFKEVGVSLNDLRTLSEEDILERVVKGLADVDDVSKRAVLQTELLGKSLRGVNIAGVAKQFDSAVAGSEQYAKAIKSAADTQQALDTSINNLRVALLSVLQPIADVAKELTASIEAITKFIKVALTIGAVIASFTLFGRIVNVVVKGLQILSSAAISVSQATLGIGLTFQKFLSSLSVGVITILNFAGKLLGISNVVQKVGNALKPLVALIAGAATAFTLFGDKAVLSGQDAEDAIKRLNEQSAAAHSESNRRSEKEKQNVREVIDALAKQAQEIRNITSAYKDNNDEFIKSLELEASYLNMNKDAAEIAKAQQEIYKRSIDTINELQKKKSTLTEEEKNLVPVIDEQIKIIEQSIIKDQLRAEQAIQNIQSIRNAQEELNKTLELQKMDLDLSNNLQALNEQLALIGMYGDELERNQMILNVTSELQNKLLDYQKQLIDLEKQKGSLTTEQYNKELAHINSMIEKTYEYAGARLEAEQQILDAQKAVQENAALGVQQAVADISKQFEPYTMAQDAVLMTWNKIGSAVDTFVQTGKFKFSDFAKSVLRDLAAMIIKAQLLFAVKSALGFFGLSIPGLAEGGPAQANKPYIVGEKGPELFVPKSSGTVVPNDQMTARGSGMLNAPVTNNYITNNINALDAKSVAQLFAENRKTLLGVTETARREMAYGM